MASFEIRETDIAGRPRFEAVLAEGRDVIDGCGHMHYRKSAAVECEHELRIKHGERICYRCDRYVENGTCTNGFYEACCAVQCEESG